ncbi:MAG TPA: hypothetical protein PLR01_12150, partial [Bacteroidales bacterium]|nr:hypothetical protein [Bacteroidales bacterium]
MKIVADEMGGIKVGCFGEKNKRISVGRLDSWTVGQNNQAKTRSGDPAILQWILNFGFGILPHQHHRPDPFLVPRNTINRENDLVNI